MRQAAFRLRFALWLLWFEIRYALRLNDCVTLFVKALDDED
jgi:hypothetical protein